MELLDWLEAEPTTAVADDRAEVDGEEVGEALEAGSDDLEELDEAGWLEVVDDCLEVGGCTTVEEDDEFLETGFGPEPLEALVLVPALAPAPLASPPALVPAPDCAELDGLLGMAPVLALGPAEIGGELGFIILD